MQPYLASEGLLNAQLDPPVLLRILQISHMNIEILAASNIYIVWLVAVSKNCLVSDICWWL